MTGFRVVSECEAIVGLAAVLFCRNQLDEQKTTQCSLCEEVRS